MAEDHRRVEPRFIVSSGMAVDPEHIVKVEADAERAKRQWRNAPEEGFGDVMKRSPAKGSFADEVVPDKRRRPAPAETAPTTNDDDKGNDDPSDAPKAGVTPGAKTRPGRPLPSLPDPRERALRAMLAAKTTGALPSDTDDLKTAKSAGVETPPTGTIDPRRRP